MEDAIKISTYHCLCSQLALATRQSLATYTTRQTDHAIILTQQDILEQRLEQDCQVRVIRFDDGFEKRYLKVCSRCELPVAYHLDKAQFEPSSGEVGAEHTVMYVIADGLQSTDDLSNIQNDYLAPK